MCFDELVDKNLIDLTIPELENQEALFSYVSEKLYSEGKIHSGYFNALIEREKNFPTGLITKYVNIALPHADCDVVKKPFVFVARLEKGVAFRQMGDNQLLEAENIFFLGIKEPEKQVGLLQKLMNMFMDETFVSSFLATMDREEMYKLLIANMK